MLILLLSHVCICATFHPAHLASFSWAAYWAIMHVFRQHCSWKVVCTTSASDWSWLCVSACCTVD